MKRFITFFALLAVLFATAQPAAAQFKGPGRLVGTGLRYPSASVTPQTIFGANLVAWWDASDASTITESGGNVSAWTSKVGGLTATQATGANQPVYSATARNGLPGITFGSPKFLTISSIATFPQGSTARLYTITGYNSTAAGSEQRLLSYGAAGFEAAINLGKNSGGNTMFQINSFTYTVPNGWNSADEIATWQTAAGATPSLDITVNGGTIQSQAIATLATGATAGRIGADQGGGGLYWTGVAQDIIVVNRIPTTPELQQLQGYEACKWALQSLLPGGHPYKSACP